MSFAERLKALRLRSGVRHPEEAILRVARNLIEKSNMTKPPYRIARYCELSAVQVDEVYLNDCDARLLPIKDGYIAEVHSEHSRRRRNFSVCHEIAHTFFCNEHINLLEALTCSDTHSTSHQFEEWLCDRAAAELLMPQASFKEFTAGFTASLSSVEAVAQAYDASLAATALRITKLDVWPCTFVYIQSNESQSDNLRFEVMDYLGSDSGRKAKGGTADLVSSLRFTLALNPSSLGLEETLDSGEETSGQFGSFNKRFSMQFRRHYINGRAHVVGFAFHGT